MIVTLTALIAATTLTAEAEAVAGDAPLDDLRVLTALAEAEDGPADGPLDGDDLDWLDLQGYAAPDVASHAAAAYARYRHGRAGSGTNGYAGRYGRGYGHGYGRGGRAGGGVFGPRKDGLRDRHGRFALNQGGFVSMPGPSGAGGRIAADALQAEIGDDAPGTPDAGRGDGASDEAGASAIAIAVASTASATSISPAPTPGAGVSGAGPAQSQSYPQSTSMLRLSFSKSYAPVGPAGDGEAVATPLPASALLFASGLGLFGVSRRRIR